MDTSQNPNPPKSLSQPCQRTGSYNHDDCDPSACTRPWCDAHRIHLGLRKRLEDEIAIRKARETEVQRGAHRRAAAKTPPPPYCHHYTGVAWSGTHWTVTLKSSAGRHTRWFDPTPDGELAATNYFLANTEDLDFDLTG